MWQPDIIKTLSDEFIEKAKREGLTIKIIAGQEEKMLEKRIYELMPDVHSILFGVTDDSDKANALVKELNELLHLRSREDRLLGMIATAANEAIRNHRNKDKS